MGLPEPDNCGQICEVRGCQGSGTRTAFLTLPGKFLEDPPHLRVPERGGEADRPSQPEPSAGRFGTTPIRC